MAGYSDKNPLLHDDQPYDESLEVPDAEEIASTYSPTPRVQNPSDLVHSRGNSPPQSAMSDPSDDPYDDKPSQPMEKEKASKKGPPKRQALLSARSQKKAVSKEDEGQENQPPMNQVVNPQAQETPQPLLPKVPPDGGKSMTASSLPQLAPKPPQQAGQGAAAAGGAPGPAPGQPRPQQPQRPQMMPQQMAGQRMPQAPMMPRIASQQMPQQMPQMMPQMRAQQMTMQQAAMRARAQMYGGQMQMAQMAQMAYMQRMQMMQMNQMQMAAQMGYGMPMRPPRPAAAADDEDDEDDENSDDSDDSDEEEEEEEDMDEEEEEENEEEPEEMVLPDEEADEEEETPEQKEGEQPPPEQAPAEAPAEEKPKDKEAEMKKTKKEAKQKEETKPTKEAEGKAAAKPGKGKKGRKRKRKTKHEIPPIRVRGVLRDHADLGELQGSAIPKPFGTPREALPDIAGMKKPPSQPIPAGRSMGGPQSQQFNSEDEDDDDDDDDDSDDDDDDDDHPQVEGAYDPAEFENLAVTAEIKELFQYITRYTPQSIELDHKLKPFIPDFIPSVGDIDAFIKIPRPDSKPDTLGLTVLDEPCAKQSDPTVLDLQLRAISKQTTAKTLVVKSLESAEKNPKAIENWIESIRELHRSKPPPNVHYSRNMPDIDTLMQEWPPEFEELLKEVSLPTADLDCDLGQFTEIICSMLDIPVYKNSSHQNEKIQALHVLFTLYSEFKNSQHFQALAANNQLDNALKDGQGDQLFL